MTTINAICINAINANYDNLHFQNIQEDSKNAYLILKLNRNAVFV